MLTNQPRHLCDVKHDPLRFFKSPWYPLKAGGAQACGKPFQGIPECHSWDHPLSHKVPRHGAPASELPVPSGSEMDGVMRLRGRGRETNAHTHLPNLKLG
ncbi:hypothetical protein H8959_021318 [Pygathrix nigripes]